MSEQEVKMADINLYALHKKYERRAERVIFDFTDSSTIQNAHFDRIVVPFGKAITSFIVKEVMDRNP